jgi:hypothetical protein
MILGYTTKLSRMHVYQHRMILRGQTSKTCHKTNSAAASACDQERNAYGKQALTLGVESPLLQGVESPLLESAAASACRVSVYKSGALMGGALHLQPPLKRKKLTHHMTHKRSSALNSSSDASHQTCVKRCFFVFRIEYIE